MENDFQSNLGVEESSPTQSTDTTPIDTTSTDPLTGQPTEIESLDRYQYQGRPLKDWESGYMRQQDYTQKTTAIAQERRYYDNLSIDLERVRASPELAEQFRQIYPEKYHAYLRYVMDGNSVQNPNPNPNRANQPGQYAKLDPATEQRINRIEAEYRERQVDAITAQLDSKFSVLSKKYPYADEEAVVARAQALLAKMKEADPLNHNLNITDKQWDFLWKDQHQRAYALADSQYKKQVQAQIQASKRGSDTGSGGGIPGQAPRQYKTIKEATNQALADIELGFL